MTAFKAYLKSRKISQQSIADYLDVKHQRVNEIANGRKKPSLDQLIGIAKYLDITTDELIKLLEL